MACLYLDTQTTYHCAGSDTQLLVLEVQQGAALLGLADQQGHMEILASIYGDPTGVYIFLLAQVMCTCDQQQIRLLIDAATVYPRQAVCVRSSW